MNLKLNQEIQAIDGRTLVQADEAKRVEIPVQIEGFEPETLNCVAAPCADHDIALGMNWLEKHDPEISFRHKTVAKRTRYNNRLLPKAFEPRKGPPGALPQKYRARIEPQPRDLYTEAEKTDSQTLKRILAAATRVMSDIDDNVRGEFPKESILPAFYKDYADIFSEKAA